MQKRNKAAILFLSEFSFLFLIYIIAPSVFLIEKNGISQTKYDNILPFDSKHTYIQSFISNRDNLNSISVLIKNPALKSQDQVKINLQNSQKQVIQSLEVSGQGIEDPGWVKLKFAPTNSQAGDQFYIETISNAKNDNDLYIYGNNENQSINFKTTYKSPSIKESVKTNLIDQKNKILQLNKFQLFLYSAIVIILNILIILSL